MNGPYSHAGDYLERGWWPLPLPAGAKYPPPEGYTGAAGRSVTAADVTRWTTAQPDANIALRFPRDVVGIDVDAYTGKAGAESLAALEAELGALPATYRITSRTDGVSGIRLYRNTTGAILKGAPAPGIEVVQYHHRYAVAPPSIHPGTGLPYRLLDEADDLTDAEAFPEPDDLPELPLTWAAGLAVTIHREGRPSASSTAVDELLGRATEARRPELLKGYAKVLGDPTAAVAGSRHDTLLKALCMAVREAGAGLYPLAEAVTIAEQWWTVATADDPARRGEVEAGLRWAIANVDAEQVAATTERHAGPTEWTDSAVAEAFADSITGRFLHIGAMRRWLRWDGRRWAPDQDEAVYEAARRWVMDQRVRLMQRNAPDDLQKAAKTFSSKPRLEAIVALARRMDGITADADTFDRHPHLLNVRNGVVDLRTGELRPHDPELRLTKLAGADYTAGAHHHDVDIALQAIPVEALGYVQRLLGYATTGETSEDVVAILDGPGGNGKTTILTATTAALGDYGDTVDARLIMATRHQEHPTLLASLRGLRLAAISETEEGGRLNAERLKAISGGDTIAARLMYGDYFTFRPTHKVIVATNHRPVIAATDDAIWRRLRLIPFPFAYKDPEQAGPTDRPKDSRLRSRLEAGREQRAAVLAWLVAGAVEWYAHGLGRSAEVDAATAEWRAMEDPMMRFITEALTLTADLRLTGAELYGHYREWMTAEGHHPKSNKNFTRDFLGHELIRNRLRVTHPGRVATYHGVGKASTSTPPLTWHDASEVRAGEGTSEGFQDFPSREDFRTTPHHPSPLPADDPAEAFPW